MNENVIDSVVAQESHKPDIRIQYMENMERELTFNIRKSKQEEDEKRSSTLPSEPAYMTFRDPNVNGTSENTVAATPAFSSFATGDCISYICGICKIEFYLNNPDDQIKMLSCGHTFCPLCFNNFF